MRRLRIGIDADGTLYDLVRPWLRLFSEKHLVPVPDLGQITAYDLHRTIGPDGTPLNEEDASKLYKLLEHDGLFENDVQPYPGVIDVVRGWHELGHELHIVSAPSGPRSAYGKLVVFERDLPFINRKNIWLGHRKHILDLDVMVDDAPEVIRHFDREKTLLLSVAQPWNDQLAQLWHFLAPCWRDPARAWRLLDEKVRELAAR